MESESQNASGRHPIVQGIELVGTPRLPNRLQSIFPHPLFNAIQSKCFNTVYNTDDNFVLSAPTGSGKTAVLELAICRLASRNRGEDFKVVYQAPTKSLCAERQKDWQLKFSHLDLRCAELTGDTEHNQLRHVQEADILVTTPEKWDSMTRKWKDHRKLMELVKLFLIDEVHILKDDRGASLEAVVSRMKTIGSDVRFVALSATVPNSEDVASWLGLNSRIPGMPAAREVFDETFRPVQLQKHVIGIQANGRNDFAFDKTCNKYLPDVIINHSTQRKPIMVFCMTRKSTEVTAKLLAEWWSSCRSQGRYWTGATNIPTVRDDGLRNCINTGVAFHHAGLEQSDRSAVEQGYLSGEVQVICCTSTLAVGINLPCHLVIIKNTVVYQAEGCKEYSDLEIMQMLGRAGRPQFDDNAVAVVMTRHEKVDHYRKMVSGQEILESRLHVNLIEHLNAEIGLGTIHDISSAKVWLKGTFLFVRFRKNPDHYRILGDTPSANVEQIVNRICYENLEQLRLFNLIGENPNFKTTGFGEAMARYYVQFETMKLFMGLQHKAKISEILSAIAQAAEFKAIRFRSGEKQMFKDINASPSIKFPIKVDLALGPHKVSLILQAALGGLDMRQDDRFSNHSQQFITETSLIFQHVHRLIRCITDCQLHLEDSIAARNALELSRSFGARAWDDSPLQLLQIEKIGPVAVRKLIGAGIKNIDELEEIDAQRLEMLLSRNPPFGSNLLKELKTFPKLRVSLKMIGKPVNQLKNDRSTVDVQVEVELGFLNEFPPNSFRKKPVHVILLVETSDGQLVHFCRISGQKLGDGQIVRFEVGLKDPQQLINCYVSCDEIAGTQKYATLIPVIPASAYKSSVWTKKSDVSGARQMNTISCNERASATSEDYGTEDLDDYDLFAAANTEFQDIDDIDCTSLGEPLVQPKLNFRGVPFKRSPNAWRPTRLNNGNWACNHPCKDKRSCKHLCCREGLDKPPKCPKHSEKLTSPKSDIGSTPKSKTSMGEYFMSTKRSAEHREPTRLKTTSNISKRRISPLQSLPNHVEQRGKPSVRPARIVDTVDLTQDRFPFQDLGSQGDSREMSSLSRPLKKRRSQIDDLRDSDERRSNQQLNLSSFVCGIEREPWSTSEDEPEVNVGSFSLATQNDYSAYTTSHSILGRPKAATSATVAEDTFDRSPRPLMLRTSSDHGSTQESPTTIDPQDILKPKGCTPTESHIQDGTPCAARIRYQSEPPIEGIDIAGGEIDNGSSIRGIGCIPTSTSPEEILMVSDNAAHPSEDRKLETSVEVDEELGGIDDWLLKQFGDIVEFV